MVFVLKLKLSRKNFSFQLQVIDSFLFGPKAVGCFLSGPFKLCFSLSFFCFSLHTIPFHTISFHLYCVIFYIKNDLGSCTEEVADLKK